MALVKLKPKGQMTLPAEVRAALSLKEGDLLEVTVENGKVSLSPKTLVDRDSQAAKERFLERHSEQSTRTQAVLKAEGKTWDDLDVEILEEVKAYRQEQVERKESP